MTDSSLMEPNNNLEAESTSSRLPTWMNKVITAWDSLQLSCNSYKYSIERMLALDEYTKTTSTLRVLIVCIGTPLPMAVLALLQECIPLQDPMAGWAANYGFWIRVGLLGGVVAVALAIHSAYMITGIVISRTQYVAVFLCQALIYSAATIVVAMVWVFPIPFMVLFFLSGYVVLFLGCYTAIVGRQAIRKMQSNKKQALHFILFISVRSIMATLYPVYQLLFNAATGTRYELPTLLLLPIIKLSTKNVLFRTCSHMEDMLPQAVIFTVDFFNSLYLATYTISASSLVSVSIVVVVDLAQIAFNAKRLYQQVTTCMTRLEDMEQSNTSNESLLVMLRSRCNDPEMIKPFLGADIRFKSCLPHQLSSEAQHLLQILEKSAPNRPQCTCDSESPRKRHAISSPTVVRPRSRKLYLRWKCRSKSSVAPVVKTKSTGPMLSLSPQRRTSPPPTKHDLLSKTLEVLFTVECILLTEYIELIVPAFYGCYVLAVTQLQSAKYHTDVSTDIMNDTFHGIYLTTIMELGAFIALLTVFRWKCSMKALSHLAFVLETQMPLVQSLLLTWILMTISFRVVHFGELKLQQLLDVLLTPSLMLLML